MPLFLSEPLTGTFVSITCSFSLSVARTCAVKITLHSALATLSCISNVGPGLGILGPMENFSILSPLSKVVLSLEMLTGRLELMPMLALLSRGVWRDR